MERRSPSLAAGIRRRRRRPGGAGTSGHGFLMRCGTGLAAIRGVMGHGESTAFGI